MKSEPIIFFVVGLFWWLSGFSVASSNKPEQPVYPYCEPANGIEYDVSSDDMQQHTKLMRFLSQKVPEHAPVGEVVAAAGLFFLEVPYVASTLDESDDEVLVINFQGVDCVTFVENALAAALTYRAQRKAFGDFAATLQCLRYRDGRILGYASRLHYFTDWLQDNASKGILDIVSNEIGAEPMDTLVNFMSSNAHLYRQLNNPVVLQQIRDTEESLSLQAFNYIPQSDIGSLESHIRNGDIIAFVTNIAGLDVSHTGIAFFVNNRLHLLHAATRTQHVEITEVPLNEYFEHNQRVTGILVARVL